MTNPQGWQQQPGGWQGQGQQAHPGQQAGQPELAQYPPPPPGQPPVPGDRSGPVPAFSARELGWAASAVALIVGLVLIGKYGYEVVDNISEKSWGDVGFAGLATAGGIFAVIGAILLYRRSRAGRVLIILGAIFAVGAAGFENALAYLLVGAAVLAAILAYISKGWVRPKQPKWQQGPGYQQGYPQQHGQQVPAGQQVPGGQHYGQQVPGGQQYGQQMPGGQQYGPGSPGG